MHNGDDEPQKRCVYDVGFMEPYIIFPDNVVKKQNEMEKRMFRFLHKQHHKNTIRFPYNFKRVLLSCAHFIFLNPC